MRVRRVLMVLGLFSLAGVAPQAHAQYFGRNAVQWERVRFEVLKTTHFDVYHYPEGRAGAEQVGRLAERWHARLGRLLDFEMKERQPIVLYASHPQFQQTHTIGGAPGEGTGGVTEAFKRRIVLPVGASLAETDHVLGHELVHAYQYAMTGQGKGPVEAIGALRMPLWFIEGMAEYLSIGSTDAHTSMWLRDAARREKGLPSIRKLGSAQYFPYRYGHALWAYLGGRFGDRVVAQALREVGRSDLDPEGILKKVTGVDHETLTKEWHAAIRNDVGPQLTGRKDPDAYGSALVTEKVEGGRLNIGPALSPDGNHLAFLSERDQLSVELFVQDTRTGKVTQRLSKSLVDPHLESLQFINSSGAWDRAGRLVALGAVAKGRPVLLLLDARSGRKVREVPLPTLAEVHTPSFSPDGHRVVFSALVEGFTDLFVYDLQAKRLRRLTEDAYADLQPAWSPDGRTVAFVTDRHSTQLDVLRAGDYRLAAVDVATGDVRALPSFSSAKNINPQWSPDGSRLYFLSDRTGITNVYALDVASGAHSQITDLQVGVSGITALSPALTVAGAADRLAYSVYVDDRYEIHDISAPERLAGWPVGRDEPRRAGLIQGAREGGAVDRARTDATTGLADGASPTRVPYKAKLGLDYVGQPSVGAGYGRNGAFFGGGVAMSFSDMLGNHQLGVALEGGTISGFTDIGGAVSYVNRDRRFNWGAQIHQIPYITGSFGSGVSSVSGQTVYLEQTLTQRQLDRGVLAQGFYPFDSALRVEVAGGYRRLGYETRLVSEGFNLRTGQSLFREKETLDGSSLDLGEATVALVRDTSAHGPTAPIAGQRFRLDVSPVFGSIRYTGVLADFRQYASKGKVTVAGRLLHYGRYGAAAEDPRMSPLFVGYGSMVRGYDTGSFDVSECGAGGGCPVYQQLLGSRVLVGNAEVRVPLKALFGARRSYGALPVDVGAFADAGVAWDSASSPALFGGEREIVKSVGAVARVNLLGFAVLEFDWVKPLDRPGKSAYFTWNLLAGF